MKKYSLLLLLLTVFASTLFADSYRITDVSYQMKGLTREYALTQKVPVDTDTVFESEETFDVYLSDLRQQLTNQRVFQTTEVTVTFLDKDYNGIIPVNLLITTQDTLNIIAVPYPSYDSNTGFTLKLKVKDYNFFGSMETMDFDLNYQAEGTDTLDDVTHIYGLNFGFSVPFKMLNLASSWNNTFAFQYTVGDPEIDMKICEGISFSLPVANITSANFSIKQYYIQEGSYIPTHDDKYFQDDFSISLPFKVCTIPNVSKLSWTPSVTLTTRWDFDAFKGVPNGGIAKQSLIGPVLSFSHSLSAGRINWLGNYRDGFTGSLTQTFGYNLHSDSQSMKVVFSSQYHKKLCSFIGLSTREYFEKDFYGSYHKFGTLIRGIRDNDFKSLDYFLLNIDLPVKLFQTNWGKLFGWDKLNFFNFEFQFSPFQDIVLGENQYAGSKYSPKDGWYGTGAEMLIFPDRFRSIQGRISFGVDSVLFLQKVGHRVSALDGLADKLFNTDWRSARSTGWYELSIGIGLFY